MDHSWHKPSFPNTETNASSMVAGTLSTKETVVGQYLPEKSPAGTGAASLAQPTSIIDYFLQHVTFYRIHLSAFTLIPLVVAAIFYACNGHYKISYLDSLFLCYSSMTVTGLSTVNLSTLTAWQQVILYFLMIIGDIGMVSWVMVLIRKRFFRTHCEYTETVRRRQRTTPKRKPGIFFATRKSVSLPENIDQLDEIVEEPEPLEKDEKPKTDGSFTKPKNPRSLSIELNPFAFGRPRASSFSNFGRPDFIDRSIPTAIPEHPDERQADIKHLGQAVEASPQSINADLPKIEGHRHNGQAVHSSPQSFNADLPRNDQGDKHYGQKVGASPQSSNIDLPELPLSTGHDHSVLDVPGWHLSRAVQGHASPQYYSPDTGGLSTGTDYGTVISPPIRFHAHENQPQLQRLKVNVETPTLETSEEIRNRSTDNLQSFAKLKNAALKSNTSPKKDTSPRNMPSPGRVSFALPQSPEVVTSSVHDPNLDTSGHDARVQNFGMTQIEGILQHPSGMSTGISRGPASPVHFEDVNRRVLNRKGSGYSVARSASILIPPNSPYSVKSSSKTSGHGGFLGPAEMATRIFHRAAPRTFIKLERKLTVMSQHELDESKYAWLNFSGLIVGRNSNFKTEELSDEQVEEVGGAEYRALRLLSYLVPAYFVLCQLISYTLFAPWLSTTTEYDSIFADQPKEVAKPWFGLFQVMGAYTGGGLSLVDLGMVPFQRAYLMIFGLMFSILAGNHALPIFLRSIIWIIFQFKKNDRDSGLFKAVEFLLDHPRRCFLYLFPSHQTWFLFICLVLFSVIEWGGFLVLNIGIPAYESLPIGTRVISGLFQGLAVRASGFSIVPITSFAPALQFLYVVMMYIAVYPVALSIRSTNVYEEQSLGVFEAPPDDEDEEPAELGKIQNSTERVGKYIGWHLRRQTSIDIWWLVWGLFFIIVIERKNLMDEEKKWFDIFRVIFELVSAFGGIGLTLGIPTENYSFAGAMKPLSKLVVIVIMVRGRHRGLPVAIDRAIKLPHDMVTTGPNRRPSMATMTSRDGRKRSMANFFDERQNFADSRNNPA